jgi:hypothetical protein
MVASHHKSLKEAVQQLDDVKMVVNSFWKRWWADSGTFGLDC